MGLTSARSEMISDERLANIEKLVCDSLNDDSSPAKACCGCYLERFVVY